MKIKEFTYKFYTELKKQGPPNLALMKSALDKLKRLMKNKWGYIDWEEEYNANGVENAIAYYHESQTNEFNTFNRKNPNRKS